MSAAALIAARRAWVTARAVGSFAAEASRRAVEREREPRWFDLDEARAELAAEMRQELAIALEASGFSTPPPATEEAACSEAGEILLADERFATHLTTFGEHGADTAAQVREKARCRWRAFVAGEDDGSELWALWTGPTPRFAEALAWVIWLARVRPRMIELHEKPAALVRPVYLDAMALHAPSPLRAFDGARRRLSFDGRELATLRDDESDVATGSTSLDLGFIQKGLSVLGSVAAHRLLRWEILEAHRRALRGDADPRVLRVDGGWEQLTKILGLPCKEEPRVRQIARAQAMWTFELPDGTRGNLIQMTERPARGQRRARVEIVVGPQLLPGYVIELGRVDNGADRRLVPMLRRDPPFVGARNHRGAQLSMALGIVGEMRSRARELLEKGGVTLTLDDWLRLGDRAGLPRRNVLVVAVRDAWCSKHGASPPLLMRIGDDRYRLSDAHAAERAFIEEGARAELAAVERGKRSAAERRQRQPKK